MSSCILNCQLFCSAARSRQNSWASSAKKIRPLEKKLGRKPATPPNHQKKCNKKIFCYKFLGQFLPIIVKIRPQLGNLELGRFPGRWLPRPQEILLGHFWVQRPWIQPSGTSAVLYVQTPPPPPPIPFWPDLSLPVLARPPLLAVPARPAENRSNRSSHKHNASPPSPHTRAGRGGGGRVRIRVVVQQICLIMLFYWIN